MYNFLFNIWVTNLMLIEGYLLYIPLFLDLIR